MVNELGLPPPTPGLLTHPSCNIIPFPPYFGELYNVLNQMKTIDRQVALEMHQLHSAHERVHIQKVLLRTKVEVLEAYLRKNKGKISQEGFELLLPYIKELFADPMTTVQAAWSILSLVGHELGPDQLSNTLMPHIVQLFSGEDSTPKHMKLYHRSFLVQLLLNLGLQSFLTNFATLLVEAVAGYKNFTIAEKIERTENDTGGEEEEEEEEEEEKLLREEMDSLADEGLMEAEEVVGDEHGEGDRNANDGWFGFDLL